jgi:hypothetical protein
MEICLDGLECTQAKFHEAFNNCMEDVEDEVQVLKKNLEIAELSLNSIRKSSIVFFRVNVQCTLAKMIKCVQPCQQVSLMTMTIKVYIFTGFGEKRNRENYRGVSTAVIESGCEMEERILLSCLF